MSDLPVSPRAKRIAPPTWLDARLVLGVLLVLVSVVVGASVLSGAEQPTYRVYAAERDVAAGTVLSDADFVEEVVVLDPDKADLFVPVDDQAGPPSGRTARSALTEGDLVLRSSLVDPATFDLRQYTLNVEPGHAPPDLRSGELVDVYVTPDADRVAAQAQARQDAPPERVGQSPEQARRVLPAVAVQTVRGSDGGGLGGGGGADPLTVVLNLAPDDVLTMVRAVASGQVDLVRVYGRRPAQQLTPAPAAATAGPTASPADGTSEGAAAPSPTAR